MTKIVLKNSDKWQTINITFDGFDFSAETIQHGAMLVVIKKNEVVLGGAEETIKFVLECKDNGFSVYINNRKTTSIREIVHAVDSLEEELQ